MDNNFDKLRKSTFGGFNRKDVVACIEKIKNEAYSEKNEYEAEVKKLNEKIAELEKEVQELNEEKEALLAEKAELAEEAADETEEIHDDPVTEINEATSHLKNVADELCKSLCDFIERISQNSYSVVVEQKASEETEEFDGEKFIAELEAELYSKLGFEENETEEEPEKEENTDKVTSILSSAAGFIVPSESKKPEKTDCEKDENKTVSDILGSLSFLK